MEDVVMTDKLPTHCFTIDPKNNEIVILNRGLMGYEKLDLEHAKYALMLKQAYLLGRSDKGKAMEVTRNLMNEEINVAKQQHDAMLHGSITGFDNPAVDKILKGEL
jgi:hypothetical protein